MSSLIRFFIQLAILAMVTQVSFGQSQDANNARAAQLQQRGEANASVETPSAPNAISSSPSWRIQIPARLLPAGGTCQNRLRVLANQLGLRIVLDADLPTAATCVPERGNADEQFMSLVKQAGWRWMIVAPRTVRVSTIAVDAPIATFF